ncbi:MAG: heavy metal translocating P-type ATPase [Thiolinea sp.]
MLLTISTIASGGLFYRYWKNKKSRERRIGKALPALENTRNSQLIKLNQNEETPAISESERQTNRYLKTSLVSLGSAAIGVVYPAFNLISIAGLIYVSIPIGRGAYKSLAVDKKVNISVVDTVLGSVCLSTGHYFTWSIVCSFIYGGQKILKKTEDNSRQSLLDVFGQQTRSVYVLTDGVEIEVPLSDVQVGDIVVSSTGENIPIDGKIVEGMASIDQQILTGESQPAEKSAGDEVFASTVMMSGRICIEVEKTGSATTSAKIAEVLTQTADFKSSIQSRGERYADHSALPTLGIASLALITTGPVAATTILNACFGFHLRILAPAGMLNFLNLAAQQGILIKDGRVLDLLGEVDTVVFDKTGTLTLEQPHVGEVFAASGYQADTVIAYAAAAEHRQTHPIAAAVLHAAEERGVSIPDIHDSDYKVGYGLTVRLNIAGSSEEQVIRVGSSRFMELDEIHIPAEIQEIQQTCHEKGYSLMMVGQGDKVIGAIELLPTLRPEAKDIVNQLQARGKSIYIISGDHETPTRRLAEELNISHYYAETLPENKAELIGKLQAEGRSVCYIGDGINDSIALKKAQVSVSLAGASTIATDTAQVILMDSSLVQLTNLFELAEKFDSSMKSMLVSTVLPGAVTVAGAFFWHFGLIHSIILNQTGFFAGLSTASLPAKRLRKKALSQQGALELKGL